MISTTVREFGGEVWAELNYAFAAPFQNGIDELSVEQIQGICDLLMGVLARHVGHAIVNDEDFPVFPLPDRHPKSMECPREESAKGGDSFIDEISQGM